jgi:hypothetical protein
VTKNRSRTAADSIAVQHSGRWTEYWTIRYSRNARQP